MQNRTRNHKFVRGITPQKPLSVSYTHLGATEDQGKIREIFETAFFIGQWLYGFAAICLSELLNPFLELAFGRQYLFELSVVMILCLNVFIN